MKPHPRIVLTVTNELTYDQRMARICTSLAVHGYRVLVVGRKTRRCPPVVPAPYRQVRLPAIFQRGFLFYAEFNLRLFFFLLFRKHDIVCAIDLDTMIPCYLVSALKGVRRVYDAHELFCEMKEISGRPRIHRFWKTVEKTFVPRFRDGYTVNQLIAGEFHRMYGLNYEVIRNLPVLRDIPVPAKTQRYILYQGAVNEGRSFETLIPAMKKVRAPLIICGDGNFMQQARNLVQSHALEEKVIFKGRIPPSELWEFTAAAYIGVTLFDAHGLSNYYSLANRFFDYMHAGVPQLCVGFPVYRSIVEQHRFALLTDDLSEEALAAGLNRLLDDEALYLELRGNCMKARRALNWQAEEKLLVSFYDKLTGIGS